MTNWGDDDHLMWDLEQAVRERESVSDRAREAARAAFSWRTVDEELEELMALAHDSETAEAVLVRSTTATEPRYLTFEGGGFTLDVEVIGDEVVGQVVPARVCAVVLRAADGGVVSAEADHGGFFTMTGAFGGAVRFEVTVDGVRRPTDWLRL
jgi:hypothetical protein